MAFQMNYSKEEISGKPPVPSGWYTLQVKAFKPKVAGKEKDSIQLNCETAIIGHAEHEGRKIFLGLNSKAPWIITDFVHACGLQMEEIQDGNQGTEAAQFTFPGVFENSDKFPDDPAQWKYLGPLTNKTFQAELGETEFQGRKRNEVRQYKCAVPNCIDKHSTNLLNK